MKQLDRSEETRAQLVNLAKPKTRDDRLIVAELSDVIKDLALKAKDHFQGQGQGMASQGRTWILASRTKAKAKD